MKKNIKVQLIDSTHNLEFLTLKNDLSQIKKALIEEEKYYIILLDSTSLKSNENKKFLIEAFFEELQSLGKNENINYTKNQFIEMIVNLLSNLVNQPVTNPYYIEDLNNKIKADISNLETLQKYINKYDISLKADKIMSVENNILGFARNKILFLTFYNTIDKLINTISYHDILRNTLGINLYQTLYQNISQKILCPKIIKIGCDPELLIYHKNKENNHADYNKIIHASEIIHTREGELGLDGCNTLGEIRPQASANPKEVADDIKRIMQKLEDTARPSSADNIFVETGGGCKYSIGGHIHIGCKELKNINESALKPLLEMLNDFIYYPLKTNMYGAVRMWANHKELSKRIQTDTGQYHILTQPEETINALKTINIKNNKDLNFASFDYKSAMRPQPHGIEYRSPCSFIGDYDLSYLILKLAQNITKKYFTLQGNTQGFEYTDPPIKEDYINFLSQEEINKLFEYFEGDKKDLFLRNTLDNWGVQKRFILELAIWNLNISHYIKDTIKQQLYNNFHHILKNFFKRFEILLSGTEKNIPFNISSANFSLGFLPKNHWDGINYQEFPLQIYVYPGYIRKILSEQSSLLKYIIQYGINMLINFKDKPKKYIGFDNRKSFINSKWGKELNCNLFMYKIPNKKIKQSAYTMNQYGTINTPHPGSWTVSSIGDSFIIPDVIERRR